MARDSKIKRAILLEYAEDTDIVNHKKWLLHNVWIRFGWHDSKSLMRNLEAMPMAWSIDRALRDLRVEGKIKLAKDIEEERFKQFKAETERRSKRKWGR
jgi:hypothetical protein